MTPSSTGNTEQPPPPKRRRPARSCQECRRRKTKCDLKQPCSHCILSKSRCFYNVNRAAIQGAARPFATTPQLSGGGPSPDLSRPEPTLHHSLIPEQPSKVNFNGLRVANLTSHCSDPGSLLASRERESEVLRRQVRAIEEQLAVGGAGAARGVIQDPIRGDHRSEDDDIGAVEGSWPQQDGRHSPAYGQLHDIEQESPGPHNRQLIILNKSRLYGPSHWTHGGHELKKVAVLMNSDTAAAGYSSEVEALRVRRSEIRRLLHRCKIFARESSLCTPTDQEFADRMKLLYVSRFESAFRILHVPSFWTEYEQYWRTPTETSSAVQFKIKLVTAIGSSLYRDSPDTNMVRLVSSQWVHAAQSWVSGPMEKDRLSLSGLQVQCLLILARQVLSISGDLIWIAVGTLARTAMQMGLHRDPKHFAKMTILHAETRRRLWATILEMNLQASLDSGVPLAMSCDDFDTESPANINDEDINESTTILQQYPNDTITDTSIQRHLLKYLRLRMGIISHVNGFCCSDFSQDEVQSITSQLNNACHECGAHFLGNGNGNDDNGDEKEIKVFKYNMADLLLRRFLITLHRPLASYARISHPTFYFSRKVCLDSATALLSPPPNADFTHIVLLGGSIFKNRIIHASLAISSELLIELEEHGPMMQWPSTYRRMLIDVLREALRQIAGRIRLGETNVRLHTKLSVVLCQAECTETGISLQQRMAQAAKESLETSYAAMQARASSLAGGSIGRHQDDLEDIMSQDLPQQDFDFSDIGPGLDDFFGMADFGLDGLL